MTQPKGWQHRRYNQQLPIFCEGADPLTKQAIHRSTIHSDVVDEACIVVVIPTPWV